MTDLSQKFNSAFSNPQKGAALLELRRAPRMDPGFGSRASVAAGLRLRVHLAEGPSGLL